MSKFESNEVKEIQEQIQPILEKLTLNIMKKKPNDIVSNYSYFII